MECFEFDLTDDQAKRFKKFLSSCQEQKPLSLRELVRLNKNNPHVKNVQVTFHDLGETYSLEELDKMLNN